MKDKAEMKIGVKEQWKANRERSREEREKGDGGWKKRKEKKEG